MLYIITKKSGLHHDMEKIKNIRDKAYKKRSDSRSDSFSDEFYSYSYLYNGGNWDEDIYTADIREINRLDHVVTNKKK